ncbi:MAG: hypothetical protein FWD58_10790 [Firmicutes bacterium]|nr:hypothetical protein [Bacillota bacterium]
MKIKPQLLKEFLEKKKMSVAGFACELEVDVSEIEILLNGEAVEVETARKFIYYVTADEAQHLIDWEALGIENPLAYKPDEYGGDEEN